MLFSRSDYDHSIIDIRHGSNNSVERDRAIPDEEPVFLIRGQDENGPEVVRIWADCAERRGADPRIVASARSHADTMEEYLLCQRCHTPDLPREV